MNTADLQRAASILDEALDSHGVGAEQIAPALAALVDAGWMITPPDACEVCAGLGWLLDQTCGDASPPDGYRTVQRCDTCARHTTDALAARSAATHQGVPDVKLIHPEDPYGCSEYAIGPFPAEQDPAPPHGITGTCSYRMPTGDRCSLAAGHAQQPTATGHASLASTLQQDPVGWVAAVLPGAIAYAEAELAATERARAYHLARYVERGTCPLGHPLDHPSCGYCANARALRDAT